MIATQAYLRTGWGAPTMPPAPARRPSVEINQPTPPKKRMSLTAIPILSKLGLGKTTSAPVIPTSSAVAESRSPTSLKPTEPLEPVKAVDAKEIEDDMKTEVDEEEHLMTEEPEAFDWTASDRLARTPDRPSAKSKLSLDIPLTSAASIGHTRDTQPTRDIEAPDGEKEVLREVEANSASANASRPRTPNSASTSAKGVWLCSKPPSSTPSSPIDENGKRRRSVGRPLVVRAMSTGRLASEFDEEGRVICLSNHCQRVLKGRPALAALPSPLEEGEELKRSVSVAEAITLPRVGITRSQTSNNVVTPTAYRRRSVEAGMRRLESFGSWSKRAIGAGDASM